VIEILDRAIDKKDMVTIEFMLKTISVDMIPHLFGELQWDTPGYHGQGFLDKNLFLDKFIDLVDGLKTPSEFDFLFELYVNKKFALPDLKKLRYTVYHAYVKYSSSSEVVQAL
jgi:hypothetical protein